MKATQNTLDILPMPCSARIQLEKVFAYETIYQEIEEFNYPIIHCGSSFGRLQEE